LSLATVMPTGRPQTLPSWVTKPVSCFRDLYRCNCLATFGALDSQESSTLVSGPCRRIGMAIRMYVEHGVIISAFVSHYGVEIDLGKSGLQLLEGHENLPPPLIQRPCVFCLVGRRHKFMYGLA